MGLFTKNNKLGLGNRLNDQGRADSAGNHSTNLYLYLSDTEWRAQFTSPDDTPTGDPFGEAIIVAKNNAKSFADINEIIQRALKKINDSQVRNIGTVSIVLCDPGVTLLDNLDSHFSYGNVAKIRQFGVESLHCDEVSYGFSPFGAAKLATPLNARTDHGVFGFADVVVLKRYLGQLDRLALKTVLIAPVAQNTIFDAQSNPDTATCGVYMGGRSTQIVICNAKRGSVTARKLPIGLFSLVDAVAKANNVSITDALTALGRRDCISQVLLDPEIGSRAENHVPGQFERILGEPVRTLGDGIDQTLKFFDVQRIGGIPDTLKLYGPVANIKGLADWLSNRLGINVVDANDAILDELIHRPRTEGINLLEGAKNPLITFGRINYAWDKDRFLPEHEMESDDLAEDKAAAVIVSGKGIAVRDAAPTSSRFSNLFNREKAKEEPKRSKRGPRRHTAPAANQQSGRAGYIILALFAFVSLYGGYTTFIAPKISEFNRLTHTYIGTLQQNAALRTKQIRESERNPVKQAPETENDKVLWTEKFLALGCYASKAVWLTDVFLTTASTSAAGKLENIQKLTIKGAILPSSNGHLLQISEYIRRLEEDRRGLFMGDFKRITFEGAAVDYEDVEEIIRFTIEGWYDKNKPKSARKPYEGGDLSLAGCAAPNTPGGPPRKEALLGSSGPNPNPGSKQ